MKLKVISLSLIALFFAFDLSAQWSPNTTSTTANIGRTGNVGIGVISPSEKLDVRNGNILLPNQTSSANGNIYFGGGRTINGVNGLRIFGGKAGLESGGYIDAKTDRPNDGIRFRVNQSNGGTERMRITAQGRVGINTTAPLAPLDVRGTNILLRATTGSSFTKFAAMGESGGPSGTSCDLYGFRAQRSTGNAINMGIRQDNNPTISWTNTSENLQFRVGTQNTSCGTLIATFGTNGLIAPPSQDEAFGAGANSPGMFINGSTYTTEGNWNYVSPANLKGQTPLTNALNTVNALTAVSYQKSNNETNYSFDLSSLRKAMPSAVRESDEGVVAINLETVVPVLTEATKEQQEIINVQEERIAEQQITIDQQQERITNLERRLAAIEASLAQASNAVNATQPASELAPIEMEQNRPNPFEIETNINYELAEDVKQAQLQVYNMNGQLLHSIEVAPGQNSVRLNANNLKLEKGSYLYTIVADGQAVTSKVMIVQ